MKTTLMLGIIVMLCFGVSNAGMFEKARQKLKAANTPKLSNTQIGAGLKEALKVGIENAIKLTGAQDGFFRNEAIKITMPEDIKNAEVLMRMLGFGPTVDEAVLSMNRAAEKSVPLAAEIFAGALFDMSFGDVRKIFQGGGTAATDYFKAKTYDKLFEAFRPAVRRVMNDYAVTKKFGEFVAKAESLPLVSKLVTVDIDKYVVSKALDGLFFVLGQQEQKIRTDPAARVTPLLQEVFK